MRPVFVLFACVVTACGSDPASSSSSDDTTDTTGGQLDSTDAASRAITGYNPANHYKEILVEPAAANLWVTQAFDASQALYPRVAPIGRLVVFFPGTGGSPGHQNDFMAAAADLGFHGINLSYPTDNSAGSICRTDVDCYAGFRQEMFSGVDACPGIDIQPADSIHDRLYDLLVYLAAVHPRQGWDTFLAPRGDLAYQTIVFAGHSQGGGHAAWVAKHHLVAGVIMFSSADDANHRTTPAQPATWITGHLTPVERYYGFDHDHDKARSGVDANWPALGMSAFGGRTSVDTNAPPYLGSHELSTDVPYTDGDEAHGLVITDKLTPLGADGVPIFVPVWKSMLGSVAP